MIVNPTFHEPGESPGLAQHWTLKTSVAGWRIAAFGPEPEQALEDFERWSELTTDFDTLSAVRAFFHEHSGHEDFELGWNNNAYSFELPAGLMFAAQFGADTFEGFEYGWSNEAYATSFDQVDSELGVFLSGGVESFEQWATPSFHWTWDTVDAVLAVFASDRLVETFETAGWHPEV